MTDFIYTGAPEYYTVPAGARFLVFGLEGASGGDEFHATANWANGGHGARLVTTIDLAANGVSAGDVLEVRVGGEGQTGSATAAGAGGWNGGAAGGFVWNGLSGTAGPGGGGGATDVRKAPYTLADRLCVAGGGAGAGGNNGTLSTDGNGGDAGLGGERGAGTGGLPGAKGTSSAGGAGGSGGSDSGSAGSLGVGGAGGATGIRGGGGGGGGYYGGGGGAGTTTPGTGGGGGGGGSTHTVGALDSVAALGTYGDGFASITPITSTLWAGVSVVGVGARIT